MDSRGVEDVEVPETEEDDVESTDVVPKMLPVSALTLVKPVACETVARTETVVDNTDDVPVPGIPLEELDVSRFVDTSPPGPIDAFDPGAGTPSAGFVSPPAVDSWSGVPLTGFISPA